MSYYLHHRVEGREGWERPECWQVVKSLPGGEQFLVATFDFLVHAERCLATLKLSTESRNAPQRLPA